MAARHDGYLGMYCTLEHTSGDSEIRVDGNMVVVGTELDWTRELHVTHRGKEVPRIILSRGANALGFIPASLQQRLSELMDAGWTCRAFAATSIFCKLQDRYLTEVALICCAPEHEGALGVFSQRIAACLAKGRHPDIALSAKELAHMLQLGGAWTPERQTQRPALEKGSAYYKTRQTATERMALAAASGNKGCYVAVVAVLAGIIAVICLLLF